MSGLSFRFKELIHPKSLKWKFMIYGITCRKPALLSAGRDASLLKLAAPGFRTTLVPTGLHVRSPLSQSLIDNRQSDLRNVSGVRVNFRVADPLFFGVLFLGPRK